jgi:hypothetical protein
MQFTQAQIEQARGIINRTESKLGRISEGQKADLLLDNLEWLPGSAEAHAILSVLDGDVIIPRADDPDSGYDSDCCACLRGRVHTRTEHDDKIRRAQGVYTPDSQYAGPWDESACMGSRD